MGTSNFYNRNASKVYAICMGYEDAILDEDGNETEETEYVQPDDNQYQDELDYVAELMAERYPKDFTSGGTIQHDNRNFSGRVIGRFYREKIIAGYDAIVTITALSRAGYYEGACLDWEVEIEGAYTGWDDIKDVEIDPDDFVYHTDIQNKGMAKIQSRNVEKWINRNYEEMVENLESIFEQVSRPLEVVARFSNGETVYKEV